MLSSEKIAAYIMNQTLQSLATSCIHLPTRLLSTLETANACIKDSDTRLHLFCGLNCPLYTVRNQELVNVLGL